VNVHGDLYDRYSLFFMAIDGRLPDCPSDFFAEEGLLQYGDKIWSGLPVIRAFFQEYRASNARQERSTRHIFHNPVIEWLDRDRARFRSTTLIYAGHKGSWPEPTPLVALGDSDDLWVRTGQGWFLERRMGQALFDSGQLYKLRGG
jgi:hypothetical protein